jgi:hypothetical protein
MLNLQPSTFMSISSSLLLDTNHFISVHYATIHHELERVGVSLKKLVLIVLAMTIVGFSLLVRL